MLKVVIIGYGEMFTNMIAGTLDSGSQIVGVFRHDRIKLSSLRLSLKDMFNSNCDYNYVKSYKLHEIRAKSVNSEKFRRELLKLNPDIMIVASWSEKISKEIYDIPKIATINVHPSLLPKYRGPNPYVQVILNGETKSGVTFHLVDSEFDTGAILDQREVEILDNDTSKELKARTVLTARGAICELLEKLSEDVIFPISQNERAATYYSTDFEHEIIFTKSAKEISRQIRAIHPWGKTYFFTNKYIFVPDPYKISIIGNVIDGCQVGEIVDKDLSDNSLTIVCGDNSLIRLSGLRQYGPVHKYFTKQAIKKVELHEIVGS